MNFLLRTIFFLFLGAIFLSEGLGIDGGREIAYFLILTLPFFLYLTALLNKKKIIIPKKITALFAIFLILSVVSTALAVNIQRSFEYLLYYTCLFLAFIFAYNFQEKLKKDLFILIVILSFIFSIHSLLINSGFQFLAPQRGYQYVYAFFSTHNPLGSFLIIILTLSLFLFLAKKSLVYLFILIVFLPFFIFSFSRSSYLAFIAISLILVFYFGKKKKLSFNNFILVGLTSLLCLIFFFGATSLKKLPPVFEYVNKLIPQNLDLVKKTNLGSRDRYFKQAMASIIEKPMWGVGPFNFIYASIKHSSVPIILAETSDNLLLEVLSENGVLAGAVFFGILSLILMSFFKIKKEDIFSHAYYFCFLASLILFQMDSSQRYYSYFLLFWIMGGLFYKEEGNLRSILPAVASWAIFIAAVLILLSNFWVSRGNNELAMIFYPLNTSALKEVIEDKIVAGESEKAKKYLNTYGKILSGDSLALDYLGETYLKYYADMNQAFLAYGRAYENSSPFKDEFFIKYYRLKKEVEGKKTARDFADKFLNQLSQQPKNLIRGQVLDWAREMCSDIYKKCPHKL